jgi:hypothetical protein
MTEYDYSPEGKERYRRKLDSISDWVQGTKGPMRDPYTPATPAFLEGQKSLGKSEIPPDDIRTHHRGHDQYDRLRGRDLNDRYGDRDKERGKHKARSLPSQPLHTKRRSSSQSVPPPLSLQPQPWQMSYSQKPSPLPQYYPQKLTSPRDSSRSSSTTRLHSSSYFPPQSSPHKYPADTNRGYTQPVLRDGRVLDFTVSLSSSCSQSNFHCRPQNALRYPQIPHSAYQVQPPPTLFKRLFRGLTGGNKQAAQRAPRRKRSSSF